MDTEGRQAREISEVEAKVGGITFLCRLMGDGDIWETIQIIDAWDNEKTPINMKLLKILDFDFFTNLYTEAVFLAEEARPIH